MGSEEYKTRGFSVKRLAFIFPVFVAVLVAMCLAQLSILTEAPRMSIALLPEESGIRATLVNVLFFVGISAVGATIYFFILKHGRESLFKMFTLAGGVLSIFLFGGIVKLFPEMLSLIFFWLWSYFVTLSIFYIVVGLFSERTKNMFFLAYGSVFGAFLGMGIPTVSTIYVLAALCVYDVLSVQWGPMRKVIDLSNKEMSRIKIAYSKEGWEIGLGDLFYYSMLTSHSFINFGVVTGVLSAALILIGSSLTMMMLKERGAFPGLPIALGLGLIPIVVQLVHPF